MKNNGGAYAVEVHEVGRKTESGASGLDGRDDRSADVDIGASAKDTLEPVRAVGIVHDKVEEVHYKVRGIRGLVGVACEASHGGVTTLSALTIVGEYKEEEGFDTGGEEMTVADGDGVLLQME